MALAARTAGRKRRGSRWVLTAAVVGVGTGVIAKLADLTDLGLLGPLPSFLGPWVVLVTVFGRRAVSTRQAAAVGTMLLLASLAGYYVMYRAVDGNVDAVVVAFWFIAALTAGPLLSLAAWLTLETGWRGSTATALPAGLALGEAAWVAVRYPLPDFLAVVIFDAVAAASIVACLAHGSSKAVRTVAVLPFFAAVTVGLLYLPRLVIGMWLGGG